jgi:hypothetical protein
MNNYKITFTDSSCPGQTFEKILFSMRSENEARARFYDQVRKGAKIEKIERL